MKPDCLSSQEAQEKRAENSDKKNATDKTVRVRKLFYVNDIFVYIGLAVLIFCLFLIFVFPSACKQNSSDGFKVLRGERQILTFNIYAENPIYVDEQFQNMVQIEQNGQDISVKIYSDESKSDFNVILFNTLTCSAKVIESTCSESKDCVYSPQITTSGSIYCAPHNLKIVPLTDSGFAPPIAG